MNKTIYWLGWLGLSAVLQGCTTSQEMRLHYAVVNVDEAKPQIKFYRLTLRGSSSNLKSSMTTGYYDANTLRYLYGDVLSGSGSGNAGTNGTGDGGAKTIAANGNLVFQFDPATKSLTQLPPSSLFTMIYGADSQALSDAIKSFADNDKTGETMGKLFARAAGGDAFDAAISAENQQQTVKNNLKKLDVAIGSLAADYTNTILNTVSAPKDKPVPLPPPDQIDLQLLVTVQKAFALIGSGTTLPTNNLVDGYNKAQQLYQFLDQSPAK